MDFLTLVILTNSQKNLGYCVAGKEVFKRKDWQGVEGDWEADRWIRLVTSDQKSKGAVFYPQLRYADGKYVELLDIVKVPILEPQPTKVQPENHLIDEQGTWEKVGNWEKSELNKLLDYPDNIWLEDGCNRTDIVNPDFFLKNNAQSLYFIESPLLMVSMDDRHTDFDSSPKKKARARFEYNDENYYLPITDPIVRKFLANKNSSLDTETNKIKRNQKLCVSLGDLYDKTQKHYKFVASIPGFDT